MAHFFPSGYPEDANAYLTENGQVKSVVVRMGSKVHLGLFGGGPMNESLSVRPKEIALAAIAEVPGPWAPDTRMFELTPKRAGASLIEAKTVTNLIWATAELTVTPPSRRAGGPNLGTDAAIPGKYRNSVMQAIEIAWKLDEDPKFVEVFRATVAGLTNSQPGPDLYSQALNKMIINLAEGSRDNRIIKELKDDAEAKKRDKLYQSAPAFSFMNSASIWIRDFSLAKGSKAIAANIIHEGAHLVGAPGNILAEVALDAIHNAAGLPR
jgi:hypothetical protein